eukprot:Rhum_TRINITY_DN14237_c9_g1::Rhum_TRINITY_DN14237_c9_g1_i1::g.75397::m.75397/K00286/proC; pyrroline-5-carboxylate reductase
MSKLATGLVRSMPQRKMAFLGAGSMGGAILRELLAKRFVAPSDVVVVEVAAALREKLQAELGVSVTSDAAAAVAKSDVVMLCVKPYLVKEVVASVHDSLKSQLIISIAAGITLETLQGMITGDLLKGAPSCRWVRVVPNVACLVGQSATTYFPAPECTPEDVDYTERLFDVCGAVSQVGKEGLLDASTGVAGSGIAYIFLVIEALADGGVRAGLPRPVALKLASQTVMGAAMLQQKDNTHPGALKDMVCSPGGTTIEAIATLERGGLRSNLIDAVHSSYHKAIELGLVEKAKASASKL